MAWWLIQQFRTGSIDFLHLMEFSFRPHIFTWRNSGFPLNTIHQIRSPRVLSLATQSRSSKGRSGRIPTGFMTNSNSITTQSISYRQTTTTILLLPRDIHVSMSELSLHSTLLLTVHWSTCNGNAVLWPETGATRVLTQHNYFTNYRKTGLTESWLNRKISPLLRMQ
jgi:hypothetical protein